MGDFRVTRATKTQHHHEHIIEVGTDTWTRSVPTVIGLIRAGDTFYTFEGGKRAEIRIRRRGSVEYLQTEADGVLTNNLLDLPPCIVAAA